MLQLNLTPEEIIRMIYDNPNWEKPMEEEPSEGRIPLFRMPEEPLEQLLAWYRDKDYKPKRKVGEKLSKLFLTLPPKEQHGVGIALLGGSRGESRSVCTALSDGSLDWNGEPIQWDPCYAQAVEECWNRYHDESCGELIAKRLDEEVVKKYWNELCLRGHYRTIYERFVNEPWFEFDRDELKRCTEVNEYLSIMVKNGIGVTEDEARLIMFQWIALLLDRDLKLYESHGFDGFRKGGIGERQIINIPGFDVALYHLLCMKHNKVVEDIYRWNEQIRSKTVGCNDRELRRVAIEYFPEDLRFLLHNFYETDEWVEYQGQRMAVPQWYPCCADSSGHIVVNVRTCGMPFEDEEDEEEEWTDWIENDITMKHLIQALDLEEVAPF